MNGYCLECWQRYQTIETEKGYTIFCACSEQEVIIKKDNERIEELILKLKVKEDKE